MKKLIWIGIGILSLVACTTLSVHSDYDPTAKFSDYHTFAWFRGDPFAAQHAHGVRNPLNARRIHDAINSQLLAKGYVEVADPHSADFVVNYTMGVKDRTDIESYPVDYRGPWRWGGPYFGEAIDVHTYREGTLSIDIFDVRSHQPVWHGWATKDITNSDIEQPGPLIQEVVAKVLQKFPPR